MEEQGVSVRFERGVRLVHLLDRRLEAVLELRVAFALMSDGILQQDLELALLVRLLQLLGSYLIG